MRSFFFSCAAATAILLTVPVASAQSAEVLIQQGLDLRRQQRDEEALQRFQDAYNLNHSAQALAQIALAEQALGRFVEAEIHLQQALAVQGDAWISTRQPQLQQALQQISSQLGTIQIQGGVPGAVVFVNGVERGTMPQAANLRVRAGSAVVEIRAQGYVPVQRTVNVLAGGTSRESIQLIAAAGGGGAQVQGGGQVQAGGGVQVVQGQNQYGTYQGQQAQTVTYESQPNLGLFWAGLPVFLAPYLLTGLITYAVDEGYTDASAYGWIPLIGPWLLIADGYVSEDYLTTFVVLSGVAQLAGVVLMVLGLATTREVAVRAQLGPDERSPVLTFDPLVSDTFAGGALTLSHF